jgi:hypothetical protein
MRIATTGPGRGGGSRADIIELVEEIVYFIFSMLIADAIVHNIPLAIV